MRLERGVPEQIRFRCNICGEMNVAASAAFHREIPNCTGCGSTPRFRGVVHAVSLGLFGRSVMLPDFPLDRDLHGLGMSEWSVLADALATRVSFVNTFYHCDPFLDITKDPSNAYEPQDFVICSEVLEHVVAPVEPILRNIRKLLKASGFLVLTTPFTSAPENTEHFPGMRTFGLCTVEDRWVVVARQHTGELKTYEHPVIFHGGPGSVLELRIFGEGELLRDIRSAGFESEVLAAPELGIGYYWGDSIERPETGHPDRNYVILARPTR